jgi:hypothetical protein
VLTVKGSNRVAGLNVPRVRIGRSGEFSVRVHNRDSLRELIASSAKAGEVATTVKLTIDHATPPRSGWLGRPELPFSQFSSRWTESGFEGEVTLADALPLAIVLSGLLRVCAPSPRGVFAPKVSWDPQALPQDGNLAETIRHLVTDRPSESANPHLRANDLLITAESTWLTAADTAYVVNPLVHRPIGRRSLPETSCVLAPSLSLPGSLDAASVHKLRGVTAVAETNTLTWTQKVQLQACGVNLDSESLDPRESQFQSIGIRNLALRRHSPHPRIFGWPSVSMVLVTNRESHLHAIVALLSKQTYPNVELVLLTHGFELNDHIAAHLSELPFPALTRSVSQELNLGEVLTVASSLASGELLTKIDDDDFYGPEHVWDLVTARMYSGAELIGKALDNIYLAAENVTVFRPTYAAEKYAKFIAGGTMLISQADLREVGGWRPVPKSVDRALIERVIDHGGLIYRTHGHGYIYVRHAQDSQTTNTSLVSDSHFRTDIAGEVNGVNGDVLRGYSDLDLGN